MSDRFIIRDKDAEWQAKSIHARESRETRREWTCLPENWLSEGHLPIFASAAKMCYNNAIISRCAVKRLPRRELTWQGGIWPVIQLDCPLILASGSPRRESLLSLIVPKFVIEVSDVDENCTGSPEERVRTLSDRKASAVAQKHNDAIVIGADTLVYGKTILGKPHTAENAVRMLESLSGIWHEVYTGITMIDSRNGRKIQRCEVTRVHFRPLRQEEIEAYAASGEPLDKAGAYAIQGAGDAFIDRIEGSYSNVVGLPLSVLAEMFYELGNKE